VLAYRDRLRWGGDLGRRGRGLRLRRRGDGDRRRGTYLDTGDRLLGDRLRLTGERRRGNARGGVRRLAGGDLRNARRGDDRDLLLLLFKCHKNYTQNAQSINVTKSCIYFRPYSTAVQHCCPAAEMQVYSCHWLSSMIHITQVFNIMQVTFSLVEDLQFSHSINKMQPIQF